jgi:hypothetical protein
VKKFLVTRDIKSGFPGRLCIACYDVNGNLITDNAKTYVKSRNNAALTWQSTLFGGVYSQGSDSSMPLDFEVSSEVNTIEVIFTKGTAACLIKSFTIYALANADIFYDCAVWSEYESIFGKDSMATLAPTTGTYDVGKFIRNVTPTETGTAGSKYVVHGWSCNTAGTFGTLNGGATTGSITSGTNLLTVNANTGLTVGQFITIAGVSGVYKIVFINGTTISLSANATATVTNAAIAYNAPTFLPLRSLTGN